MPERGPPDPLRGVGPADALAVLRQLVSRHPSLTSEVQAILREWRRAGGGPEALERITAIAPGWGHTLVGAFAR